MTGTPALNRENAYGNVKPVRLIGMSGSLRTGSYSNAILATLREKFAGRADLQLYDLAPIPLYNQDFEGDKRPPIGQEDCSPISRRPTGSCCARRSSTTASPAS